MDSMADRSWMNKPRLSAEYVTGAKEFIAFARANNIAINNKIKCPCLKCNNCLDRTSKTVFNHLLRNGICPSYTQWYHHGETSSSAAEERCHFLEERCNELQLTIAALEARYNEMELKVGRKLLELELKVGRKLLELDALKNAKSYTQAANPNT